MKRKIQIGLWHLYIHALNKGKFGQKIHTSVTKTEYDQFTHSFFLQAHKLLEQKYLVPYMLI
jgi:hypothetical protein